LYRHPAHDGEDALPLVEAIGASGTGKGLNTDGRHLWHRETAGQRPVHHLGPVSSPEVAFLPDPEINGAQILRDVPQ